MITPLEYIKKPDATCDQTPPPPNPIKLAIIGPPKSGKTTLAKRFSVELGVMKISIEDIVQLLVSKYSNTIIAQNIHAILLSGAELPTDLLMIGLDWGTNRKIFIFGVFLKVGPFSRTLIGKTDPAIESKNTPILKT